MGRSPLARIKDAGRPVTNQVSTTSKQGKVLCSVPVKFLLSLIISTLGKLDTMETFFFWSPLTLPARFKMESRRTSVGEVVLELDGIWMDALLELTIMAVSDRDRESERSDI